MEGTRDLYELLDIVDARFPKLDNVQQQRVADYVVYEWAKLRPLNRLAALSRLKKVANPDVAEKIVVTGYPPVR